MNSSDPCEDNLGYKCPIVGCNAVYTRKSNLEVHKRKHTGERPFVCKESGCSKSYTNEAHLKRHICCVHTQTSQTVMCSENGCGMVLSNKYSLRKHYIRIHNKTNKYAYNCFQCSQGFHKKRQLKKHLYLHTGGMLFTCTICNIGFTANHLYNKHMRNHKTYTCDCGATFARWTIFCAHRRVSCNVKKVDHRCVICNKTFTTKTNLTQHSLVHLSESQKETYWCPYMNCKRSYQYKKNLNYHIVAFHEKLKDAKLECAEPGCKSVLKSKKNLKQHILAMHSNMPKEKKPRKPRKDKGIPKKCMAAVMSGVQLPLKEHSTVISSAGVNSDDASESNTESNSAINFDIVIVDEQPLDQNIRDQNLIEIPTSENGNTNNLANATDSKLKRVVVQN